MIFSSPVLGSAYAYGGTEITFSEWSLPKPNPNPNPSPNTPTLILTLILTLTPTLTLALTLILTLSLTLSLTLTLTLTLTLALTLTLTLTPTLNQILTLFCACLVFQCACLALFDAVSFMVSFFMSALDNGESDDQVLQCFSCCLMLCRDEMCFCCLVLFCLVLSCLVLSCVALQARNERGGDFSSMGQHANIKPPDGKFILGLILCFSCLVLFCRILPHLAFV